MAPSVILETSTDFAPSQPKPAATTLTLRILLLSPPSLSSHPERLENILAAHDRRHTDIQMLDRLALSLVYLPESTYDLILLLADADSTTRESHSLYSYDVFRHLYLALKAGGKVQSQEGRLNLSNAASKEAIFAGFVMGDEEIMKPDEKDTQSIPLRLGKKKNAAATTSALGTGAVALNVNGKRENGLDTHRLPAGVGYDSGHEDDSDDELIDENTLLDEADMKATVIQRKPQICRERFELM